MRFKTTVGDVRNTLSAFKRWDGLLIRIEAKDGKTVWTMTRPAVGTLRVTQSADVESAGETALFIDSISGILSILPTARRCASMGVVFESEDSARSMKVQCGDGKNISVATVDPNEDSTLQRDVEFSGEPTFRVSMSYTDFRKIMDRSALITDTNADLWIKRCVLFRSKNEGSIEILATNGGNMTVQNIHAEMETWKPFVWFIYGEILRRLVPILGISDSDTVEIVFTGSKEEVIVKSGFVEAVVSYEPEGKEKFITCKPFDGVLDKLKKTPYRIKVVVAFDDLLDLFNTMVIGDPRFDFSDELRFFKDRIVVKAEKNDPSIQVNIDAVIPVDAEKSDFVERVPSSCPDSDKMEEDCYGVVGFSQPDVVRLLRMIQETELIEIEVREDQGPVIIRPYQDETIYFVTMPLSKI